MDFRKIRLYSAPMAGFTNIAHRELLRFLGGVDLIATEMVSARSFLELDKRNWEHPSRLWGVKEEARPLSVQIWDNDPETLSEFARRLTLDFQVSVVDLNFGCPAKQIAGRSAGGSYLLQFPERIGVIVQQVVRAAAPVPVTAKIRLGRTRDTINAVDVAQAVEAAGAAALTVHGRTAADMYRGTADWNEISKIKPKLRDLPLIGNGDIRTVDDALFRLRNFPVDGIMIGRGGIARPWLFRQIDQALRGESVDPEPTAPELRELIRRHYEWMEQRFDEKLAAVLMRKYACRYSLGRSGARVFRNAICSASDKIEFFRILDEFLVDGG